MAFFCYDNSMDSLNKRSNKLLWIALLVFGLSCLIIIGYYWLLGGYFANSSLTISIFVGLQLWSVLLFCAVNIVIAIMILSYILTHAKIRSFLWRFLMIAFVIAYIGLSVSAKTPDNEMMTATHQFFSHSLFLIISLITLYTILVAKDKLTRLVATIIACYAVFFITSYLSRADYLMNGILWYESAFIVAFFVLVITSNRLKLDKTEE